MEVNWKWVPIVGGVFAILFGVWKADDRYAKCEQVEKQFIAQEQKVVQTLDKFQEKIELKSQHGRLDTIRDQTRQIKIQIKKTPNDSELQEQIEELSQERTKVERRIEELEKKK